MLIKRPVHKTLMFDVTTITYCLSTINIAEVVYIVGLALHSHLDKLNLACPSVVPQRLTKNIYIFHICIDRHFLIVDLAYMENNNLKK